MYECTRKIGTIRPRHARDIPESRIGVGFETLDRSLFDPTHFYKPLGECGIKWARLHSGWARTEKEKDVYDFAWLDDIIDNLRSNGIQPWLDLVFGNPVHMEIPDPGNSLMGWGCPPIHTPEAREAWKRYVGAVVSRYQGVVSHFEIWNEPDHTSYWKPHGPNATEYGLFASETARTIRENNPDARIFGFALASFTGSTGLEFVKEALDTGLGQYIDYVTVHRYSYSPEEVSKERLAVLRALLDVYNPKIGIIQGESGCPSAGDGFGAMSHMDWNETKQAKWLSRMIVSNLAEEYFFTSYFTAADIKKYRANCDENWAYFGLLREDNYTPKPSYFALRNLCTIFAGDCKPVKLPFQHLTSKRNNGVGRLNAGANREYPDVYAYRAQGFSLNGRNLFAYWNPVELPAYAFDSLTTVFAVGEMKRPLILDPLTGDVLEILPDAMTSNTPGTYYMRGLPVKDYPLILTLDGFDSIQLENEI